MTTAGRRMLDLAMSEKDWQQSIINLARLERWRIHHCRPGIDASPEQVMQQMYAHLNGRSSLHKLKAWLDARYKTALQGDPGYPDLTLAHPDGLVVIAELKRERGKATPEQARWLEALNGAELYSALWRPSDWNYIEQLLRMRIT